MPLQKNNSGVLPDLLLSAIYPHRCPVCDGVLSFSGRPADPLRPEIWVHPQCCRKLEFVGDNYCMVCGKRLADDGAELCRDCSKRHFHFSRNLALLSYNAAARDSVVRFKYYGRQQYALYYGAELMKRRGEELLALKADALIPVPIHRSRLRKRGYNQAELLAAELSRHTGIPLCSDLLLRTRRTRAQKALGPEGRIRNLQDALRAVREPEGLRTVILVDDIYTTGSTLEACSRVLLNAGVERVFGVTLCVGMGE